MIEQPILEFFTTASGPVLAAIVLYVAIKAAPGIAREVRAIVEAVNQGKRIEADAKAQGHAASHRIFELATQAMNEMMAEQRRFNAERTDNMITGMRLLEGQLAEVKEELHKKDERIKFLESENAHKDSRIAEMQDEIDALRAQLDKGKARPPRKKGGNNEPTPVRPVGTAHVPAGAN